MKNTQPSLEQLATLHEISSQLNSSLDLDEVLDYVMDRVVTLTGAEQGFLMLYNNDTHQLEFQVARGLNQEDLERPAYAVSKTIIKEVINTGEAIVTLDAQYDDRIESESIVTKGLRSILCVPIKRRAQTIGLVYLDNRLRTGIFNETHRYLVSAFASDAGFAIENARLYALAIEQGRLQRELEMARTIQQGLLPRQFDPIYGYQVAFDWQSAREVAGDFYDCLRLDDEHMGLVVGDVSDKGAAAAIFMAVARSLFRSNATAFNEPIEAVGHTNSVLYGDAINGMFVTLYYAVYTCGGQVQCINAGHNLPIIYRANSHEIETLPRGGQPLGWFPTIPLREDNIQLEPGDVMLLYTDGLTEAENTVGEAYGIARLEQVLADNHSRNATIIKQAILRDVGDFTAGATAFDDITLIVVRYLGTD